MERGCVICSGTTLLSEHLPAEVMKNSREEREVEGEPPAQQAAMQRSSHGADGLVSEKVRIFRALDSSGGNKAKAARLLGMDRTTLYRKLKKYAAAEKR